MVAQHPEIVPGQVGEACGFLPVDFWTRTAPTGTSFDNDLVVNLTLNGCATSETNLKE